MKKHLQSKSKTLFSFLFLFLTVFGWGQTNPTAFDLSTGSWTLTGWNTGVTSGKYPGNGATGSNSTTGVVTGAANANMVFWKHGNNDPVLTTAQNADYSGAYSGGNGTITGNGTSGFYFDNTGGAAGIGSAVLAIKTTGRTNIQVAWTGRTIAIGARTYQIRLQYRVGTTGSFLDASSTTSDILYTGGAAGTSQTMTTVTLPSGAENQPVVQLLWRFYYSGSTTGTRPAFGVDDITVSSSASSTNDTDSNVTTPATQANPGSISSVNNTSSATALNVFNFKINDKATADALATKVTQITLNAGASNTANWTTSIAGIKISKDGGFSFITTGTPTIGASSIVIPITSGNLDVASGSSETISVFIYLNSSGLTDNNKFQFTIPTSSYGFTADSAGSTFASTLSTAVTSNIINLDVVATKLTFTTQPTDTAVNATMVSPVVRATDANGNVDADYTTSVSVTSTGILDSTPKTYTPLNGVATLDTIVHTAIGSNLTLNATSGSLASATSSTFNIILQSSASDYFRSKGTGNWGAVGSWESSSDNVNWISATLSPTSSAAFVTVRAGHTITVSSATSKNLTVESGGFLTVNASFSISGTNTVNGTWNQSTTTAINNTGTLVYNAGSVYNHLANGGTIPTATWNVASNCNITGFTNSSAVTGPAGMNQTFGNLTFNNSGSSNYINLFSGPSSITVNGTFTVGPSTNNNVSFSNSTGTITANINKIIVSGGYLSGVGASAIVNLTVNTDLVISGNGIFRQSSGTGTANVTVNNDVVINDNGVIQLVGGTNSNVAAQTLNVQRDFIINGVVAQLNMKPNSTSSAVPTVNVGRNFSSNNTDAGAVDVDFGAGTVTNSAINITGNLTHTGNGVYQTSSSSQAKGFVLKGSSVSPSQISYSGVNSDYVSFVVDAGFYASLLGDLTLSSVTGPTSYFTVNGSLNFNDKSIIGNTVARFITATGATLATSNVDGLGGTMAMGSLKSFGSTNTTSTNGTAQFNTGVNYIFNGDTVTPFPTGTFGNPASLTFNNADVTSNRTVTLTVTGAVNINGTSKFALNSVAGNDLALGGVMTIGANASFDSNGENQINNAGGSVVVNGTFITKDAQGFSGTNATIPTITNITLNTGSTIQYALDGAQAISSRTDYKNLLFTGNGTKSSNNSITPIAGTVTVNGVNTILDVSNNTFGDSSTNLTMLAGWFRLGGSGVKPDISGAYSLSAGTTIEFTGTSATQIRLAPQYANVVISGTNVVAGTTTNGGLTFRTGGNFTVKNGARFKVNNDNGFSGGSTTAIKNTNSPVITLETGSTIDYTGSDQIVTNILPYQNLTISTAGTKTSASGNLVVNNLTTVSAGTLKFLKTADNATPNVLYAHKGINNVGGSVIFENNAQLMQDDDANNTQATIQSQRDVIDMNNVSTQMDYVYWSSPVNGQNIKTFSPNTPANGYLQYNESNDKFSVTSDANFQIGKGYAIRAETGTNGYNKSYVFTGIPHNSSLDSPNLKWTDSNHGYNLVGNPYPSNINFDALFANNSSKIYSTAWFWTNNSYTAAQLGSSYNGNNYAVYNGTGGSPATYNPASPYTGSAIPNGIVKVGQAFIVQAKSTGKDLPIGFINTMRSTLGGNFFQKNSVKNRFWLTMTSPNNLINTILVGYITGATNNYETDFDGELFEVGSDSFYSLLGAKKLAIQGRADIFSADDVVGLGNVYSANGSYSIKLQGAEGLFDGSQKIYLRDKLLNKYVDMTSDQVYQFTAVKGTDNTRFEIVYKDQSVLGASDAVKSDFIVYKDGNEQVIKSDKKLGRIELFDASGKLIRSYVATSNEFRIDTSTLMNALYIIKVNNSGEIRTKKFIK